MSSHINMLFDYMDTNNTEFIHIKDIRIPIFNIDEGRSKGLRIEYTEQFLRLHYELIDDPGLIFLANFLYHQINDYKEYDDFSRRVLRLFSSLESIRVKTYEYKDTLMEEIYDIEDDAFIIRLFSKANEPIYILPDNIDNHPVYTKDLIQIRHSDNLAALQALRPREKGIYYHAERRLNSNENTGKGIINNENTRIRRLIARAVAALMVCFPKYIKAIQAETVKRNLLKETAISRIYHENSKKRTFHLQGDFMLPLSKINDEVNKLTAWGRKSYPKHYKRIKLASANYSCGYSVEEVVLRRRSRRKFSNSSVSIQKLSNILYYSYGITGKLEKADLLLRAVPSEGGLYTIDIYISVNRVEGLERGIYYYDPFEHEIVLVNHNDLTSISKELSGCAEMLDTAAFTFVLGANFWRNQWKYYERGYRAILIDCGHVAQNLHMLSTAYELASCCLMDFVDDELNKLLELDGIVEHSLYLIAVGVNRDE